MRTDPQARPRARRWRRRAGVLALATLGCGVAVHLALPRLATVAVRRELAARGYPDARFTVASVGLDHLRLTGVRLADGLVLGDIELDAGIALLWRAPTHATVRHARIAATALRPRGGGGGGGASAVPVGTLTLDDAVLQLDATDVAIAGTIARAASGVLDVHATARLGAWDLGPINACEVSIEVRGADARDAVTIGWAATGAGVAPWIAHGGGRVGWAGGTLALTTGSVEVDVGATRSAPAVHAEVSVAGPLSTLALDAVGVAETSELAIGDGGLGLRAHDVRAPIELALTRAGLVTRAPVVAGAATADVRISGERVAVTEPRVELAPAGLRVGAAFAVPTTLAWRGQEARYASVHIAAPSGVLDLAHPTGPQLVAWRAATAPGGLAIGEGALDVRGAPDGVLLAAGRARALGGELTLAPARLRPHQPIALAIAARGMTVPRVLAALHRADAGTGAIDADLAIRCAVPVVTCGLTAQLRAAHPTVALAGLAFTATGARVALAGHATATQLVIDSPFVVAAPTATVARGGHTLALTELALTVRAPGEAPLVASSSSGWPTELRWRAATGALGDLHLTRPSGTASRVHGGAQTIAWRALAGPWSMQADDGELALQVIDGKARVIRGHLHALAGELAVVPSLGDDIQVHARGLALGRLLAAVGDGHLAGSGLVDGELAISPDGTVASATLRARTGGVLRVTDPAWRAAAAAPITGISLQQRLRGALADFAYTQLVATLAPPGARPELRVALQGQGAQALHQALDVELHVNGARDAVHGFTHRESKELP